MKHPAPFLKVRVSDFEAEPWLVAMCAGYENGEWREDQLIEHAMEWLPEFSLKYSECVSLGAHNAVKLLRKAAKALYKTEKFKSRGEFGELFLHMILRQVYGTIPAICKMHYKDSRNDTVKGFDCVHVVSKDDELELWIGEVKFYKEITSAIRDVVKELHEHTERDYLRDEFVAITNKIDETWPHSERLKKLLDENASLDDVFDSVAIPVLLTYDSKTINGHKKITKAFEVEFEKEIRQNFDKFVEKEIPECINVSLILLPLRSKEDLQSKLHGELQLWS
ncbi:DUF1837 domain-containing protein [Billgrantia montanilacus]|uniref:DUF1837 domain-containing protein n=2 Tax=Billgrantia montanilacus TaxID=2282305 RepID=A0A368TQI4_9GAMM|nr:DUF1837 domain-containing protein [Halomonas montanilacus]